MDAEKELRRLLDADWMPPMGSLGLMGIGFIVAMNDSDSEQIRTRAIGTADDKYSWLRTNTGVKAFRTCDALCIA